MSGCPIWLCVLVATFVTAGSNSSSESSAVHASHSNVASSHGTSVTHAKTLHTGSSAAAHAHPHDALLFCFTTLFIGCILSLLISRLVPFVPYTVTVYILGMIVGKLESVARDGASTPPNPLSASILQWSNIDPHLMLHAFLPALLFGDSLNVSKYHAWVCQGSCTLLATCGVVYGAFLTACVMYYISPIEFTWNESWTAGSIMAATDPVAVVAILKSLGASEKLNMLVSGESLMNDGVAIVVYTIFHDMSLGDDYSFGEMIGFFFKLFFGGAFLGLLFGMATLAVLHLASDKMQHEDTLIQTSAMFSCAYLSFWVAESKAFHVSGVLATVVSALVIGFYGKHSWVDRSGVQHVFHFIEYAGNTLLFMVAGVIIGEFTDSDEYDLSASDCVWPLALFVFGILIRGLVVFTFFPALNRMGAKVTWQEAIVLVWGGLRGAVGLALAVEVSNIKEDRDGNPLSVEERDRRQHILFQCSMFATLTLLINAPTTGFVVKKLGLIQEPAATRLMRLNHETSLAKRSQEFFEDNKMHPLFMGYNSHIMNEVMAKAARTPSPGEFADVLKSIDVDGLLLFQRESFLRFVRASYWKMHDTGVIPIRTDCMQQLTEGVEYAIENVARGLTDWNYHKKNYMWPLKGYMKVRSFKACWELGQMGYVELILGVLIFIAAHQMARDMLSVAFELSETLSKVMQESLEEAAQAEEWLKQRNPKVVQRIRTRQFARAIMEQRTQHVYKLEHESFCTSKDAHHLLHHDTVKAEDSFMMYFRSPHSRKPRGVWPEDDSTAWADKSPESTEWDGYE